MSSFHFFKRKKQYLSNALEDGGHNQNIQMMHLLPTHLLRSASYQQRQFDLHVSKYLQVVAGVGIGREDLRDLGQQSWFSGCSSSSLTPCTHLVLIHGIQDMQLLPVQMMKDLPFE